MSIELSYAYWSPAYAVKRAVKSSSRRSLAVPVLHKIDKMTQVFPALESLVIFGLQCVEQLVYFHISSNLC